MFLPRGHGLQIFLDSLIGQQIKPKNMIDDPQIAEIVESIAKIFKKNDYYNEECFKDLMKAVNGYYNEPCFKELVKKIALDFEKEESLSEPGILQLLEDGGNKLQSIQDVVIVIWDQAFRTLEYEVELLRWSLLRVDPKSNFAIFAIASNGLCVASEISWLLRGGYADGAMARQRTLLELISVTGFMVYVGRDIDKDIGTRWLDSEHVTRFKIYDKKIKALEDRKAKTGLTPEEEGFYNSHLSVYHDAKKKYDDLIEKYGPEFKGKYGWAKKALNEINIERVAKGKKKVNVGHDGIRAVTLPFLEHLYVLGNFAVHGGEEPIRAIYPIGGDYSKKSLTLGPTIFGIEHVLKDTVKLVHILAALITFAFNNENCAIASAVIKALDLQLQTDIEKCIKNRELYLHDST
jgi:hypothetical protein